MPGPIRTVLIGLRPILADALSLLLRTEGSIDVLGSVTDVELPAAADVLIFDGRAKTELGAAIRWWKQRCPQSRVIAVDVDADKIPVEWIAGGLDGFVGSDAPTRTLVEAIHRSIRGETICPYPLLTRVVERIRILSMQAGDKASLLNLTRRETEVLHLLAEGLSNKEIAVRLNISLYTVKNHVHSVLEKLKVRYRRQAIRYALDNGLLKPGTPVVLPKYFSRPLGVF
jgi:DNA-binding NarL/FixJ family response regulator